MMRARTGCWPETLMRGLCMALAMIGLARSWAAELRPNILLAIADDQSWAHTSAQGYKAVRTPAFDRVAALGVRFDQCMAASPGCSPSRAALLTGLHHWQVEEAGTHASSFPAQYVTYPDLLEQAGYFVGYTGKGWGPGNWKVSGRDRNPAGPAFDKRKLKPPHKGMSANDYAANFADFLAARPADRPFCFWYGGQEPHRAYEEGSGVKAGKRLEDAELPPFLPDAPEVRSDLLDYCLEIEWFDSHLARMLKLLGEAGQLENTLVIVTGDNGMPFPRAKANMHEYGIHVPLAIAWTSRFPGGRVIDDPVGFVDLTATILEAAKVTHPAAKSGSVAPVGRSLFDLLLPSAGSTAATERMAFSGRERHSSSRHNNLGYPSRALRTSRFLYIRNFAPDRWPAGDPQKYDAEGRLGPMHGAYHDIDSGPTLDYMVEHHDDPEVGRYLHWAVDKRPAEELYDAKADPGCLANLAGDAAYADTLESLRGKLENVLRATGDPRMGDNPEIWETYPRYSPIREFPPPDAPSQ